MVNSGKFRHLIIKLYIITIFALDKPYSGEKGDETAMEKSSSTLPV